MFQTQEVKCPYCGYERTRSWSPSGARSHVAICEQTIHHPDGCGRQFVIDWNVCVVVTVRKIEGQSATKEAAE